MKKVQLFITISLLFQAVTVSASKLVSAGILDKDYLMLYFRDGDVSFNEGAASGCALYANCASENSLTTYGSLLNTANAAIADHWKITSTDDPAFGGQGISPSTVYRKSKLGCMAQMAWSTAANDFTYDWAYEHTLFLKLPQAMQSGKSYTIHIPIDANSDVATQTLTFDIFQSRSEAVKVNIVGYSTANSIKAADVYLWMGDGGSRDYSSFEGKKIYIYNTATQESQSVGTLSLWKQAAGETRHNHQMLRTNVWKADFTGFNTPGTYRLAVEDIGCSDDFTISDAIYYEPFKVSTQGFYYMRIGEDNLDIVPVPRRPLYIPGVSPVNCTVYITTLQPYDSHWPASGGDPWDNTTLWTAYCKPGNPTNPNAYGGHADAFDWDRHLGHVSIIYDMLLPYYLTGGALSEDNLGITESGNGIPDLLDEARNEVDFWLRLRDGRGYSHGLNNPNSQNVFYQAGTSAVAAWANAANAALLADCFRISGHTDWMAEYCDSAKNAYSYASSLPDPLLDKTQDVGEMVMTGKDFRITAAAFLYNLTGDTRYEDDLNAFSRCTSSTSTVWDPDSFNEIYALAGYLFTNQKVNYPALYNNMKSAIIREAKSKEANYSTSRPSRRSTDNDTGWFITVINNERTIIAHALSSEGSDDKALFENALILEADFSLGRNPMNRIHMTIATTGLADKRSIENAYTSGWNDGTPGVHPGHTPYMNQYDWGGLIMGCPTWMTSKNYPAVDSWPYGELYYNTRYVYAANEFTPQQSMRGKTALYGYLHAISPAKQHTGMGEGILLAKNRNALHIYPVPANEIIQISDVPDGTSYTIYSVTGMKIASGVLSGKTINISQLAQGAYFIVINNFREKFIKL
ncbi:MAG: T9SS type A sorting domain-containing protein [Candidatus Azobacteroides sp.]|nr:T9SS type A sorting domain-containing protein [Candidatus Azobacteroides sp.]